MRHKPCDFRIAISTYHIPPHGRVQEAWGRGQDLKAGGKRQNSGGIRREKRQENK